MIFLEQYGTCPGNGPAADKFKKPDGTLKPDVPSGYFSEKVPGGNFGSRQPLNVRQLWSYACPYVWHTSNEPHNLQPFYTSTQQAINFCKTLTDAAGNTIPEDQLPPACGGNGPEVLVYNAADVAASFIDPSEYDVSEKVQKILKVGVVIFILILLIAVGWKFLK